MDALPLIEVEFLEEVSWDGSSSVSRVWFLVSISLFHKLCALIGSLTSGSTYAARSSWFYLRQVEQSFLVLEISGNHVVAQMVSMLIKDNFPQQDYSH